MTSPARTSLSDPLRIDTVAIPGRAGGRIGITFCPGKRDNSLRGTRWERDLAVDLDVIQAWGASALVSLIEDHEFELLGVPRLGEELAARGIEWHHLPIVDRCPPDERFERGWPDIGGVLRDRLARGERIVVHCRGGLGRAGTVAALLLAEFGVAPAQAIRDVRAVREGAVETRSQENYLIEERAPRVWAGERGASPRH